MSATKKRKLSFAPIERPQKRQGTDFALDTPTMKSVDPVRGEKFRRQLGKLAAGRRTEVLLSTTLPVRYSTNSKKSPKNLNKPGSEEVRASYTLSTHASSKNETTWTQGWMLPAVDTKWRDVLPEDLSLRQATRTGRVIKSIMGQDVKPFDFRNMTKKDDVHSAMSPYITPATLSFVEDVTGTLATSTAHTGSAIRASYLASKLMMKNEGLGKVEGFRDAVMGNVTQLNADGAVTLARTIKNERAKSGSNTSAAADDYAQKIAAVHDFADGQVRKRFDSKHTTYTSIMSDASQKKNQRKRAVREQLGEWWADADRSNAKASHTEYRRYKYTRYGIG
jgi:hypothetical protein